MVLSIMVQITLVEVDPVLGVPDGDKEGWTLVTRQKPKNKGKSYHLYSVEERGKA